MTDNDELLKYFIEQTNKRFDEVDAKLEKLLLVNAKIFGGVTVISGIVSLIVAIFFHHQG